MQKEIYSKELAHTIVDAWQNQNLIREANKLETQKKGAAQMQMQSAAEMPLSQEVSCLFDSSLQLMGLLLIEVHLHMEGNLFYQKSINLNVNLKKFSQKHVHI